MDISFNSVTGSDVKKAFYKNTFHPYESTIEEAFNQGYCKVAPNIEVTKDTLVRGITDGVIRMYDEDGIHKWVIQECKRDFNYCLTDQICQGGWYVAQQLFSNPDLIPDKRLTIENFGGLYLNNNKYFIVLAPDKMQLGKLRDIYNRYDVFKTYPPSKIHLLPDLRSWALSVEADIKIQLIDDKLNLGEICKDTYYNDFNIIL